MEFNEQFHWSHIGFQSLCDKGHRNNGCSIWWGDYAYLTVATSLGMSSKTLYIWGLLLASPAQWLFSFGLCFFWGLASHKQWGATPLSLWVQPAIVTAGSSASTVYTTGFDSSRSLSVEMLKPLNHYCLKAAKERIRRKMRWICSPSHIGKLSQREREMGRRKVSYVCPTGQRKSSGTSLTSHFG